MTGLIAQISSYYDVYAPRQLYRILKRPEFYELRIQDSMPDVFWMEKIIVVIDFFQLFGLLWNASNPWPWPYLWLRWTRYFVLGNVDVYSLTSSGAILGQTNNITSSKWGHMSEYMNYASYFAITNGFLYSVLIFTSWLSSHHRSKPSRRYYQIISNYLLVLASILYLPVNLAVFRLYHCESGALGVDSDVSCSSSQYAIYVSICSCLVLPSFIGLPYYIYKLIKHAVIFKYEPADHEKYIQIHELSCILGLQNEYVAEYFPLFSSYKLTAAYYRSNLLLFKALLLILFIFCRTNLVAQATLYLIATVLFMTRYFFVQLPFRCPSTNIIHVVSMLLLLGNTCFAAMNAFGARNAILVASIESYILASMNMTGFVLFTGMVGYCITSPLSLYPPIKTILNIITNEKLLYGVKRWLADLYEAEAIKYKFLLSPTETSDIVGLETSIRDLRRDYTQARALGSIFQNMIGDKLLELHYFHAQHFTHTLRQ
jgi:hypothetical protein